MPESPLDVLVLPPFGWIVAGLWGALWGSFFNVAIHRLGREDASLRSLLGPPSHCPRCNTPIRAYDNVPLLGWLLLRGRCRSCKAPISIRYPAVELVTIGFALAVYWCFVLGLPGPSHTRLARFLVYFFFVGTLEVLALIDLDTMLLPEAITLPAIPFFFIAGRIINDVPWLDAVIGLAVGFGALKGLQLGYAALTGREGLGGGDSMLMAIVGGFLGWQALPFTLGLGATFGTMVALPILLVRKRRARSLPVEEREPPADAKPDETDASIRYVEVPFGPFLVAGALCWLFFSRAVKAWLLGWVDEP